MKKITYADPNPLYTNNDKKPHGSTTLHVLFELGPPPPKPTSFPSVV